ncbi:hypothetical protein IE81DRAFT_12020 [Ceraceosorus guamensis]|uniref:Uncharacterized protein n=1 Tax=Ceraceosorus guamensis TaxID=1522189 RepID=A0A316W436_9BASI|nr:hypothetical protein IE81DRAFT_12020 [Ceraceosorus guamensis]PWN44600.1 hypothetical protein IE81DRAFT_12020 [Ceraceosorus guamensis]
MAGKKRKASGTEGRKEDAKRQATESASGSTPATAGQVSKNAAVGATMVEASQGRANVNYVARFFDYKERLHKANSVSSEGRQPRTSLPSPLASSNELASACFPPVTSTSRSLPDAMAQKRDGYHDALRRSMTKHCDLQEEIE